MNIILSAGMPRSGSTWMFNVIRLLMEEKIDPNQFSSCWIDDFDKTATPKNMLIKIHDYNQTWSQKASIVFYSYRDIRDAIVSFSRKFGIKPSLSMAQRLITNDRQWRFISAYNMRYESMLSDPLSIIEAISELIGVKPDSRHLLSKLNMLDYNNEGPKNDQYHLINLLHKNHKTNGRHGSWKEYINKELLIQIENEFKQWFDLNGYSLSS